ncbi:Hypothetical predicted protein [Paramuricea clavata]|uniref:Uncharacterized protein n=1 Tax=Paramuricea clavata TaxID=317549 RepID=A0A6S7HMG9_PARCT|nr:Hypothetical predicted protein [Paramuricea clavata]
MESTVEISSEEYEAAKILLSLKYSGNSDTGPQFPSGSCAPIQTPMIMLSPCATTSALPIATPYVLWHDLFSEDRERHGFTTEELVALKGMYASSGGRPTVLERKSLMARFGLLKEKPCYGKLIKPKLAEGVKFDTERVIKMAGQGAVYVRSLFPITEEDEDDEKLYNSTFQTSETGGTGNQTNVVTHTFTSASSQQEQISNAVLINGLPEHMCSPHFNGDGILDVLSVVEESESNSDTPDVVVVGSNNVFNESNVTVVQSGSNGDTPEVDVVETASGNNVMDLSNVTMVEIQGNRNEPVETVQVIEQQQQHQILKIHRLNVKKDMINAFKDPSVMDCDLTFVFIDGRGNEEKGSGVGVYLPLLLSKTFLSYVLFGESSISDPSILIQSFMQYISADERRIIDKGLSGDLDFENEDEFKELLDVLKMYDCRSRVTQENIKKVIQEIAHKKIIQKPQYVTDCGKILSKSLQKLFPLQIP